MSNDELNRAIQLIQQGQHEQAQPILQTLIRANQQDMTIWSWYVKSCRTSEKRLEALELCLRFNPGNPQVIEGIRVLREKLLEKQIYSFTPEPKSEPILQESYPYAMVSVPETVSAEPVISQPAKFVDMDGEPGRAFAWYDVWWMAITQPNSLSYTALLRDTNASPGRGYWWVFLTVVLIQLLTELGFFALTHYTSIAYVLKIMAPIFAASSTPELRNALNANNLDKFIMAATIVSIVAIPFSGVLNVFWLIIVSAIHNLIAKLFGGTGNFNRMVYLETAFTAPLLVLNSILSLIGQIPVISLLVYCLSIAWFIYIIVLHVVAIQAAHRLNVMRALMVVLIPAIAAFLLFCLVEIPLASQITQVLKAMPRH